MIKIKIGIVCGCLPTQHGINQANLYHQLLAERLQEENDVALSVSSIWYTTIASGYSITQQLINEEKPDVLLFHLRPDPYLRMSKLWIKYNDNNKAIKTIVNRNADDSMIYDDLHPSPGIALRKEKAFLHLVFRQLNYLCGIGFGCNAHAIEKEKRVIDKIMAEAKKINLPLIVVGPASRASGFFENFLLQKLEHHLSKRYRDKNYVTCTGLKSCHNENSF